jgi:hypothetical protein
MKVILIGDDEEKKVTHVIICVLDCDGDFSSVEKKIKLGILDTLSCGMWK